MKMRVLLVLAFALASSVSLWAQPQYSPTRCITVEVEEHRAQDNPDLISKAQFENWLAPLVETYQDNQTSGKATAVVTIPVVFHVIHDGQSVGSGANLDASYVNSQLSQLNSDFGGTDINFCMAQFDIAGNAMGEPGINRIDRNAMGWSAPPYGRCGGPGGFNERYIEGTIKPQSIWNPDEYLNIWVMEINCGILGYAQFPNASGLSGLGSNNGDAITDGVVVHTASVGATNRKNPGGFAPYNEGRTLTHEIGHFFGLRHIWGDGGCSVDDYCNDTPLSDAPNFGCPNGHVSCGSVDQVENFMDYTDDACMSIFTNDQNARMAVVVANSPRRASLTSSPVCSSAGDGGGGSGGGGNGNGNGGGKPKRVDGADLLGSLEVFPVPAHDHLNVQFDSETAGEGQIAIVDLLGRTLVRQTVGFNQGGNIVRLDLSQVPAGSYLLQIRNGDAQLMRRISIGK